jgi:hypothetical protein
VDLDRKRSSLFFDAEGEGKEKEKEKEKGEEKT